MDGGGSSGSVGYAQSPEQQQVMQMLMPMFQQMFAASQGGGWQGQSANMPSWFMPPGQQQGGQAGGPFSGISSDNIGASPTGIPGEQQTGTPGGAFDYGGGMGGGAMPGQGAPATAPAGPVVGMPGQGGPGGQNLNRGTGVGQYQGPPIEGVPAGDIWYGNQQPAAAPSYDYTREPGFNLWDIPDMPSMYDLPDPYNIPQVPGGLSTLSPELQNAMFRSTDIASKRALEGLGGSVGSARGGASGLAGDVSARIYGEALPGLNLAAQQMQMPGWQAQLGQNQQMWGQQLGQNVLGYQGQMGQRGEQLQQNQYPWNLLPGLFGQSQASPVVQPGSPSMFETLGPLAFMAML